MQRNAILTMAVPAALLMLGGVAKTYGDDHDKKTVVQFSEPVQIPGGVILQPGKYVLILLNSSSNRNIVEIRNEDSTHLYAMTFTTRANRVVRTGDVALTFYEMPAGTPPALRQWYWPGDYDGQEFLYPHKQALEITQASHQTVPELPADQAANQSAGVSAAPTAASASDSSVTDSSAAAVAAESAPAPARSSQSDISAAAQQSTVSVQTSTQTDASVSSQPSFSSQQAVQPEQQLAQLTPPADTTQRYSPAPDTSAVTASAPAVQSSNDDPALPQTASDLPLIAVLGFASIMLAVGARFAARGRV
jgi:hypothetical protein